MWLPETAEHLVKQNRILWNDQLYIDICGNWVKAFLLLLLCFVKWEVELQEDNSGHWDCPNRVPLWAAFSSMYLHKKVFAHINLYVQKNTCVFVSFQSAPRTLMVYKVNLGLPASVHQHCCSWEPSGVWGTGLLTQEVSNYSGNTTRCSSHTGHYRIR